MSDQTLDELALNILIEGKFNTLPIKITHLAKINRVDYLNNFEHDKFENCTDICQFILESENMNAGREQAQKLALLVMAPSCVLKACKISSAEHLHVLTAVPIKTATALYQTLNTAANETMSDKEKQVVNQFQGFIDQQLSEKPQFHRP